MYMLNALERRLVTLFMIESSEIMLTLPQCQNHLNSNVDSFDRFIRLCTVYLAYLILSSILIAVCLHISPGQETNK